MRAGHKSKGHRKCPLHDLTLTCRIFLSRIINDSAFFIDNKGRTAINPNIFIYVLDGLIGLFTGGGVCSTGKLMCKCSISGYFT